ncbi:hypothetical protein MKW94_019849 [Papaver nudicaule]|uniref:Uncharacterized protein n=1 Tax=Papaver nudicaule TaxID=74823 RepID=A0AA41VPQ7_PAPNU|nr:hypothetical protein [Papaver nudicaule]
MQSSVTSDVEGMLSLYEASFYAFDCEDIPDEVQDYTRTNLTYIMQGNVHETHPSLILKQVSHALETPLNWRVPRLEAKWFIENYKCMTHMEPLLLEFAILDFNMVQATYQEDLKYVSRWWQDLNLIQILRFSRDRGVEDFFWTVGFYFNPKFSRCRRQITKVISFVTTIDDIYDRTAREHINHIISDNWKRMNKERLVERSKLPQAFIESMPNMTRMAQFMYQRGDGYGVSDSGTKEQIMSIVVEPIHN